MGFVASIIIDNEKSRDNGFLTDIKGKEVKVSDFSIDTIYEIVSGHGNLLVIGAKLEEGKTGFNTVPPIAFSKTETGIELNGEPVTVYCGLSPALYFNWTSEEKVLVLETVGESETLVDNQFSIVDGRWIKQE